MKKIILCVAGITLLSIAILAIPKELQQSQGEVLATSTVIVVEKPTLRSELVPICACESTGDRNGVPTHYELDGSVKKGRINELDTGICQINLYYHGKSATSMGLDLFKEDDNITYANHLYETEGSQPWSWSRSCWDP